MAANFFLWVAMCFLWTCEDFMTFRCWSLWRWVVSSLPLRSRMVWSKFFLANEKLCRKWLMCSLRRRVEALLRTSIERLDLTGSDRHRPLGMKW